MNLQIKGDLRTPAPASASCKEASFLTNRRGLLKGLGGFFATVGLGSLFYGLYRFLAPGGGALPVLEIPLNKITAGGFYTFQYGSLPGIAMQDEDGSLQAFSLVCTHLACTVAWKPEKKEFYCPCHDAIFDAQGRVLGGPPSSPLERWNVQVKNEKVLIGIV